MRRFLLGLLAIALVTPTFAQGPKGGSYPKNPKFDTVQIGGELNRATTTLNSFGDSITAAQTGIASESERWVNIVSTAKGWSINNRGIGGASLPNIWTSIYETTINQSSVSTLLVGQNEATAMGAATNGPYNWFHGLLGSYLWLLTPNKILANSASVTKTGTWVASDLVSFGLKSTVDNSTAQVKMMGTAVYVVAHATNANAATIKVTVDSVDYGPYVIANNYQTQNSKYDIPWAIRVAGLPNTLHTVTATCTTNTTGTCYLDYFTSNSYQATRSGPFLWAASPYKTAATPYYRFKETDAQVRAAVNQLASDGLGIVHVDLLGACGVAYGVVDDSDKTCGQHDGVHPNAASHQVIANTFLSEMDNFPHPQAKQAARSAATDTVHVISTAYMGLGGATSAAIVRMIPPVDLTIERVIVYMESQMANCSTPPSLVLCKGSCTAGNFTVLLNGANATGTINSGPIEVLWPANVEGWMQWQGAVGCTGNGGNFHVNWMYRMARD